MHPTHYVEPARRPVLKCLSILGGNLTSVRILVLAGGMSLAPLAGHASSILDVIPESYAAAPAQGYSGALSQPIRSQQVYPAHEFPSGPVRITSLRWRRYSAQPFENASGEFRFKLSTTSRDEGTLSSTFSENVGPDETMVFDGVWTVSSTTAGDAPHPFEMVLQLSTPFVYNPAEGNLLLEHQCFSTTIPTVDAAGEAGDGLARAYNLNLDPNASSASVVDTGGEIIQFEYTLVGTTLTHVIPDGLEGGDGNYYAGTLYSPQMRSQVVYGAANFPGGSMTITELRFRRDVNEPAFNNASANVTVKLSTTTRNPGGLSATFAENSGSDETTVFNGLWTYSSPTVLPGGTVRPFEIVLPLSTPFTYNPSAGNLLFDIRTTSNTGGNWTDGVNGNHLSRVQSPFDPDSATGATEQTGDVFQLVYQTTATLEILPNGGTFTNSVQVSLASGVSNSVIRYTTNGDDPTGASAAYTVPFTLTETATVKARLFVNGFPASEIVEATYALYVPPDIQFNPPGQLFTNQLSVTLVNNVGAGTIRYTMDGAEPTSASTAYSGPLNLTAGATIRARVFLNTFPISEEFSETYARVYAFGDDGVPFAWREQYFGPGFLTNPCAAAGADCDDDGYSVTEEYQYTTDPTDGDSAPEILLTVRVVPKLTFTTIPGRSYRIDRTTTLNPPDWQTIVESVQATGAELHYVDEEAPDNSFYRIELVQD